MSGFKEFLKKKLRISTDGEIILSGKDFEGLYNRYYARASNIYRIAGLSTFVFLILFLLICIVFNMKSVTYENLYYFVKDFDSVVSSDNYEAAPVIYSYEENRTYQAYKGGIVTAGKSSMSIYSATGRKTTSFYPEYSSPVIRTSSKYVLLYDQNAECFSVYNSFARLYSETLEYPIRSAYICDSGEFIIVTASSEYKSVIYRYNRNFNRSAAYYYNNYVTAAALSPDGEHLIVSSTGTESGMLQSKMLFYKRGETEATVLDGYIDSMTLLCGISASTGLSGKASYYYADKNKIGVTERGGESHNIAIGENAHYLVSDTDSDGIASAVSSSGEYKLYIASVKSGTLIIAIDEKPVAIRKNGDIVYVLYENSVARYNVLSGTYKKLSCTAGAEDIIISSDGYVFVCYASRAVSIKFD